jgi:hypothetical protein
VSRPADTVAPASPDAGFDSGKAEFARRLWWERRVRTRFFPAELFGEPAWDLILDAFASEAAGEPVRLSKAHLSACVSPAATHRRVRALTAMGILDLPPIEPGHRAKQLTLTAHGRSMLARLLDEFWFERSLVPRPGPKDPAGRTAGLAKVRQILSDCQNELDLAGAWHAGAYLSQAISILERDS